MEVINHCWLTLTCTIALLSGGIHGAILSRADIRSELGAQLSEGANIYFPGVAEFEEATDRWSTYQAPNFTVVVEVSEEEDVSRTVRYANSQNIPFLAVNGGHGTISSLSKLDHGIEIWLHKLDSVEISEDGKTATFGGGIGSLKLAQSLFAEGKQTVHGVCECVSYLGPGLGGGHGALQGRYGLVSDQFLSMHVVTADGEIRDVSAHGENSDLWWALQGAGHNFGIVTSVTSKIYDVPNEGLWAHEQLIFRGEQVEDVFDLFNQLSEIQPPGFLVWSYILRIPDIDPQNPIILSNFVREGVSTIEPELIEPFRKLSGGPSTNASGLYTDIPKWLETAVDGNACSRDLNKVRFPIGFSRYNSQAQQEFFETFAESTAGSSPFNASVVLLEQYSMHGVQAVPKESTAFPHRRDNLLISPSIQYLPTAGKETELQANALGDTLREILLRGTGSDELRSYVNYAAGDEGPESWYGYEPWRQERLSSLKRKYDPEGKFSYYAPIIEGVEE